MVLAFRLMPFRLLSYFHPGATPGTVILLMPISTSHNNDLYKVLLLQVPMRLLRKIVCQHTEVPTGTHPVYSANSYRLRRPHGNQADCHLALFAPDTRSLFIFIQYHKCPM